MIADNFELNEGEAMVHLTNFMNITSLEMTIQEGKYIDERISLVIPNMDATAIQGIFQITNLSAESVLYIEAAPAQYTLYSDLH